MLLFSSNHKTLGVLTTYSALTSYDPESNSDFSEPNQSLNKILSINLTKFKNGVDIFVDSETRGSGPIKNFPNPTFLLRVCNFSSKSILLFLLRYACHRAL